MVVRLNINLNNKFSLDTNFHEPHFSTGDGLCSKTRLNMLRVLKFSYLHTIIYNTNISYIGAQLHLKWVRRFYVAGGER